MNSKQLDLFDDNPEYTAFVEKFKPKKTTDDCYTPDYIYDAVLGWATEEYNLGDRPIIRPFYPGGDYEHYTYPADGVVVDNPPFSILAKIIAFYIAREIDFFLFAPGLTVCSSAGDKCNVVISDSAIIYENGANVKTAFVTNMGAYKIHVSSELHDAIRKVQETARNEKRVEFPKYEYPDEVLTAAIIQKIASKGQTLRIPAEECWFIRSLDAQKSQKKTIFGSGFILSERAAAERAAAERANATFWKLSNREKEIVRGLGHAHR